MPPPLPPPARDSFLTFFVVPPPSLLDENEKVFFLLFAWEKEGRREEGPFGAYSFLLPARALAGLGENDRFGRVYSIYGMHVYARYLYPLEKGVGSRRRRKSNNKISSLLHIYHFSFSFVFPHMATKMFA